MILYESSFDGVLHRLGTSGFLYRSNKVMYDQKTQSLWNTLQGRPVVGPLVGKKIALKRRSVVTTTWKAWKVRHPQTKVLDLKTGFRRDYDEGVAYRDYFANDRLMFRTVYDDRRLLNKAEVLGLRFGAMTEESLAISSEFLRRKKLYEGRLGVQTFVILTDKSGAHRVYARGSSSFESWDEDRALKDAKGERWTLSEDALRSTSGLRLPRLPQHRAFWFGWRAAFPQTKLIGGRTPSLPTPKPQPN